MGRRRALAAAGLAICLVWAPVAEAKRPDIQLRGVNAGNRWDDQPEAEQAQDLRSAAALGADTVRVGIKWNWLAPDGRGRYIEGRVQKINRLLNVAKTNRLRVVATVAGTPCWAARPDSGGRVCNFLERASPPRDPRDYGAFVRFLADRWGRKLAAIEVWNEPNRGHLWSGTPRQYVQIVRAAKRAIDRSRRPHPMLLAGALAGSDVTYLDELYRQGLAGASDAVSIHPYDFTLWEGFRDPRVRRPGEIASFEVGVPAVRRTMLAHDDRSPLWITEFGYPACPSFGPCVSRQQQADYLSAAIRRAAEWRYVDAFLVFKLRDLNTDPNPHFGLLDVGGARKPVWDAVARVFRKLSGRASRLAGAE